MTDNITDFENGTSLPEINETKIAMEELADVLERDAGIPSCTMFDSTAKEPEGEVYIYIGANQTEHPYMDIIFKEPFLSEPPEKNVRKILQVIADFECQFPIRHARTVGDEIMRTLWSDIYYRPYPTESKRFNTKRIYIRFYEGISKSVSPSEYLTIEELLGEP